MAEELGFTLFFVLATMFVAWLVLVDRLFATLRTRHVEVFAALGSPSLIVNNSAQNNLAFMRFLLRREDRVLNDPALSKLCRFMVCLFWIYAVFFGIAVISTFVAAPPAK